MTDFITHDPALVRPLALSIDKSLPPDRARHLVRVTRLFCTFWHTGETRYLQEAVEPSFIDHTLPTGRAQGPSGAVAALAERRAGVPDLTCELTALIVADDRAAIQLHFRGTFTGVLHGVQGSGQPIDFIAFDILHIGENRIVEDWHLEDNLTLLMQAGLATVS